MSAPERLNRRTWTVSDAVTIIAPSRPAGSALGHAAARLSPITTPVSVNVSAALPPSGMFPKSRALEPVGIRFKDADGLLPQSFHGSLDNIFSDN